MDGKIHSIETFGLVDGPGVRYVLFLQGCNMRCKYCHNPETWSFDDAKFTVSAKDAFSKAYKYKNYWRKNGKPNGGITVSGGEPLLQIDFVSLQKKKVFTPRLTPPALLLQEKSLSSPNSMSL